MIFDHIGVAVKNMDDGKRILTEMLGIKRWTTVFEDPGIGVYVQFGIGPDGPTYELIAPLNDSSPIAGALKGGKNILNHVAYLVEDLATSGEALRELGCLPVADAQPAVAYQGKRVQFFLTPLRLIIELIEAPNHRHSYLEAGKNT